MMFGRASRARHENRIHTPSPKASLEEIQITSIHHFLPAFRPKEMVKGMLVTWISSFLLPLLSDQKVFHHQMKNEEKLMKRVAKKPFVPVSLVSSVSFPFSSCFLVVSCLETLVQPPRGRERVLANKKKEKDGEHTNVMKVAKGMLEVLRLAV